MGKRSKGARSSARTQQRKADKAAKRALYESFGKAGRTKGSRRAKRKAQAVLTPSIKHPCAHCGNAGCARCFPDLAKVELKTAKPCLHRRLECAKEKASAWLKRHPKHPLAKADSASPVAAMGRAIELRDTLSQVIGGCSGSSRSITSEQAQAAFSKL